MSKAHINTRTLGASLASRLISEAKHVPSQEERQDDRNISDYLNIGTVSCISRDLKLLSRESKMMVECEQ